MEQIVGISSMATRFLLAELSSNYVRMSGLRMVFESVGGVAAAQRVQDGELFDVVVLADEAIDRLSASGHVMPDVRIGVARSGIAIAVAAGVARPLVDNEAAVREAILAAHSIGYSTGPSGTHLMYLLDRWHIREAVASRMVQARPGIPVGVLVARGEVELGLQQLSELVTVRGIDILGSLPPEIQATTLFSATVCKVSPNPGAALKFLAYLNSTDAMETTWRHGMEPA